MKGDPQTSTLRSINKLFDSKRSISKDEDVIACSSFMIKGNKTQRNSNFKLAEKSGSISYHPTIKDRSGSIKSKNSSGSRIPYKNSFEGENFFRNG